MLPRDATIMMTKTVTIALVLQLVATSVPNVDGAPGGDKLTCDSCSCFAPWQAQECHDDQCPILCIVNLISLKALASLTTRVFVLITS